MFKIHIRLIKLYNIKNFYKILYFLNIKFYKDPYSYDNIY